MKIHSMMLVRNETGRWLEKALEQHKKIADRIVILDDNSYDDTYTICKKHVKEVYANSECMMRYDENKARKKLWDLTIKEAKDGDIILCLDADELFDDTQILNMKATLKYFADHDTATSLGFVLYDMWDKDHFRDDVYWTAHRRQWRFALKYYGKTEYLHFDKALHCGRLPNFKGDSLLTSKIKIKHMGWSRLEDRQVKYFRYMETDPKGLYGCMKQYRSILDEKPNLVKY